MNQDHLLQFRVQLTLKGFLTIVRADSVVDLWIVEGKFSDGRKVYINYVAGKICFLFFQLYGKDDNSDNISDITNTKKVVSEFLNWTLLDDNSPPKRRGDVERVLGRDYGVLIWLKQS